MNPNASQEFTTQALPVKRANNFQDLTGKVFGRLTVIGYSFNRKKVAYWVCLCSCGTKTIKSGQSLRNGHTKSCGCLQKDFPNAVTHGRCRHNTAPTEYKIWIGIKYRCNNPHGKRYHRYGGRGITLSKDWEKFEQFFSDMGPRPGPKFTIERINNDLGYSKSNCKWATYQEQASNTKRNRLITYLGETKTVQQWSDKLCLRYGALIARLNRGWDDARILTVPIRKLKSRSTPTT